MLESVAMRIGLSGRAGSLSAAIVVVLASACSSSPPHPRYVAQSTEALLPVPIGPPPARVEAVPPPPAKGAVWVDGEWTFRRGRWAWVLGRWVIPAPGTAFSPWTIVRDSHGDLLHAPGIWRDARGRPTDPPPPLAFASAQPGPVVDSEGVTEVTGRTLKSLSTPDSGTATPPSPPSLPP
jgi:hypothetical protein